MSLLDQVRQVVSETIEVPEEKIDEHTTANELDEWDSLAQVNLMMALEQAFDLELEVEDFMNLNSIQKIVWYISKSS